VAVLSATFSLKESRREMLPAQLENSQNAHQVGNHAGGVGTLRNVSLAE
jgi:hypothetical protein